MFNVQLFNAIYLQKYIRCLFTHGAAVAISRIILGFTKKRQNIKGTLNKRNC